MTRHVVFDTEFTHLDDLSPEPPGLLSIGALALGEEMNIFFDTEFTHIKSPQLPAHQNLTKPQLLSLGAVSFQRNQFYAENKDAQLILCSDFTREHILPHLEGGNAALGYMAIAQSFRDWIEAFNEPVVLWTDAPAFTGTSFRIYIAGVSNGRKT